MRYNKFFFLIIIASLIFACSSNKDTEQTNINELSLDSGWQIKVTDTIFLDVQTISFHLLDYNPYWKGYVAFDAGLNLLMEFDQNFQLKNSIDLSQEGPNSFGPQCFGLTYYQDSLLAISGLNGFHIYKKDWSLVQKFKRPENTFPNVQSTWEIFSIDIADGEQNLLSAYVDETAKSSLQEYNPLAIASLKREKGIANLSFFGKMDARSLYLDASKNYPVNEVMFTYNEFYEHIYKINRLEPIVYVYNKYGDLHSLLNLNPENFDEAMEVDPNLSGVEESKAKSRNDRFMALYTSGNLMGASFFTGTGSEGIEKLQPHVQFVIDEKVKTNIITMRKPVGALAKILPNKKLLFFGSAPQRADGTEYESKGTVFYLADLVKGS